MYRYMPPKPQVWGHRLPALPPLEQHARVLAFEQDMIAGHARGPLSLHVSPAAPATTRASTVDLISIFERALGVRALNGWFMLAPDALSDGLALLNEKLPRIDPREHMIGMKRHIDIRAWRIGGELCDTRSMMIWTYGTHPHVMTELRFDSEHQFEHIAAAFEEHGLCKLTKSHLREDKRRRKLA